MLLLTFDMKFLVTENKRIKGSLTGVSVGTALGEVTQATKVWRSFQALGAIAFAYSFSLVLIEIQVPLNIFTIILEHDER